MALQVERCATPTTVIHLVSYIRTTLQFHNLVGRIEYCRRTAWNSASIKVAVHCEEFWKVIEEIISLGKSKSNHDANTSVNHIFKRGSIARGPISSCPQEKSDSIVMRALSTSKTQM